MKSRRVIVAVALAAAFLVAVLCLLAATNYDVRGEADVPYDAGTVKEVRVFDSVTVYVDGEPKPGPSIIGAVGLMMMATAAFMTAAALWIAGRRGRLIAFYALIAAGLSYAGLDELFAFHETIGHNLQFLADLPGVNRPDDVILASYVLPLGVFGWVFRDILLGNRHAMIALAVGVGLFSLSAAGDLVGNTRFESYMELSSALCLATGLALLMYAHLRRNLAPDVEPAEDDEVTVVDQRRAERPVPAGTPR